MIDLVWSSGPVTDLRRASTASRSRIFSRTSIATISAVSSSVISISASSASSISRAVFPWTKACGSNRARTRSACSRTMASSFGSVVARAVERGMSVLFLGKVGLALASARFSEGQIHVIDAIRDHQGPLVVRVHGPVHVYGFGDGDVSGDLDQIIGERLA